MVGSDSWDGFYAAYMTGEDGQGFAMFVFANGKVVGADPLGVRFDGQYEVLDNGYLRANINVTVPPDGVVVQGASSGPSGLTYGVLVELNPSSNEDFFLLPTPLGPVNVRLEKLRSIGGLGDA